ncbi:MAG: MBG domain-containing protein, partial [Clostridia bacterium]|nr:MBG domain-containing protein [Clostridia bacterium]
GYQGNYITLFAYTDAVYSETFSASANPDISTMTAKQLLFTTSSGVVIEYVSNELVEINNAYYSKTTAKMYLSNSADIVQYGITAVTVGAEDNINYDSEALYPMATRIVEDGYVEDFGGNDPTPLIHRIFIKKNHTASGSFLADITKTYGDEVFDITAGLNSGLLDYTVTCDNTDILSLTGSGVSRAATIKNAGTVTLTLFHPGITNLESPLNSYISVRAEITLTVEKAILSIVPVNKTTVYGTTVSYADIAASFLFGGFCYTDDFDIISSVASNYDPLIMRDVDSYPLKASDAVLNTTYQNYDIVYPENIATLTVTPKTLYAFIDDAEKEYGQENPVLDVSYTGFVYDETQTTAAELVAPVVNFNGVNSLTPVGQYIIGLNGGSARNYTIDVSDIARLTISSAFVTIQLEEKTADYNAKSIYCNAPEIVGVQGGTTPTGTAAVYYLWGEDYSEIAPVDAGSYGVKIVYTSGPNDNYKDTVREISCAITVLPIDPLFVLEEITVDYNAAEYDGVPAAASVEAGVAGGTSPIGTLSFFYSREGGEFTQSLPKDSGAYTVRAVYHLPQGATDNYKDGALYDFEQGLIIEKIDVSIDLEKAVSTYASSDKLTPDRLSANQAVAHGVFTEYTLDSERYPHTFSYKYLIDGEWVSEAPFNAGYYDVEVSFTALGDLNYRDTVAVFEQAIEILRATPSLSLEPKAVSYTGKRIAQNPAIATGIEGGSVPQGGFEYLFAPHGGAYGLFSRDYPVVNVNLTDGVNEGYDIIVRYLAAENDNYANNEQRFDQALTVLPVNPRILFSPSMANFSGSAFDISKIIASASGISGGSLPLGNLSYEFMTDDGWSPDAPVNSGSYSVKVTFTPATESTNGTHANYMTASGVFVDGIIINKVSPIITINPVKSDYTGSRVTLSLDNNEVHIAGVSPAYPPAGSLKIQYALAEDEWSDDGPTESGIYKIRIVYTATESENYTDVTKIFNNAITIYNIAPVFVPLTQETLIFSGERAAVTFEPQIVGNPGKGSLILNYKVGNSWTSRAPSDAGIYDVRINYIATIKDNYKSYMQAYPSVLVILPKEVNIAPLPNQNKVFDNMPVDTIEYMVSGLVAHDTLTGSLTIGQAVDAGAYTIEQGTLQVSTNGRPQNYQNNYRLLFTEGVLFEILPAEAEVTFGEISESLLVYRPYDNKEQYISVNAQYQGANIPVEIDIIGDDTYVGSFFVEVTICDNNYYISPENSTK